MTRPADVPNFFQCVRGTWDWTKWLLSIVPLSVVMVALFDHYLVLPAGHANPDFMRTMHAMYPAQAGVALFLWVMIFLNGMIQYRMTETPLEREAREIKQLERLKAKYGDQP